MINRNNLNPGDIIKFLEPNKLAGELFIIPQETIDELVKLAKSDKEDTFHIFHVKTGKVIGTDDEFLNAELVKSNRSGINLKIRSKNKLQLVKAVKELTGLGLKEAKDLVDKKCITKLDLNGELLYEETTLLNVNIIDYKLYHNKDIEMIII